MKLMIVIFVIAFVVLPAWIYFYFLGGIVYTYRFKLTVELNTPGGLKTASGVFEVYEFQDYGMPGWNTHYGIREGEAIYVETGAKPLILIMATGGKELEGDYFPELGQIAFSDLDKNDWKTARELSRMVGAQAIVRSCFDIPGTPGHRYRERRNDCYPTFVSIDSVVDPKTIKVFAADEIEENLGRGVKLARITISIVDEPIHHDIVNRLLWLTKIENMHFLDEACRGACLQKEHFVR